MPEVDAPVNQAASEAARLTKKIESILVPVIEKSVFAACPELGLPLVKQIVDGIIGGLSDELTKYIENGETFAAIDVEVDGEKEQMSNALMMLITAEKDGSADAIKKAIENYSRAQSALIRDDGSFDAE
jgi:hypothetical protein